MNTSMKPIAKTLAGAAVVLAGLAGCASKASTASSTAVGAGAGGQTPASAAGGGASSSTPGTSPTNGEQTKFTSAVGISIGADGKTLTVPIEWGGCSEQPTLEIVSQDSAKVVVEVKTVSHFKMGAMCPNYARSGQASATLAAPLGSRTVVDATNNQALSIRK